jgi:hypothetical protein
MSAVARTDVVGLDVVATDVVGFEVVGLDVLATVLVLPPAVDVVELVPTLVVGAEPEAVVVVVLDGGPPTAVEVELETPVEVLIPPITLVVVPESPPCDSARAAAAPPPTPTMIPIVLPLTPPEASAEPVVGFRKLEIPSAWNPGGSGGAPGRVAPTAMFGFWPVKNSAAGSRRLHSVPDETGTVLSCVRNASKLKVTSST